MPRRSSAPAQQAEGDPVVRHARRARFRPEERREGRRRLDGPARRVAELLRHHEPVPRLRLEERLGARVERVRVGIPDQAVDGGDLGRPRDQADQEDAARVDAPDVDRAGEAEGEARIEVEAVQLAEETLVVAGGAPRDAPRGGLATRSPVRWARSGTVSQSAGNGLGEPAPTSNCAWTRGGAARRARRGRAPTRPRARPPRGARAPPGGSGGRRARLTVAGLARSRPPGHLDGREVTEAVDPADEHRPVVAPERVGRDLPDVGRREAHREAAAAAGRAVRVAPVEQHPVVERHLPRAERHRHRPRLVDQPVRHLLVDAEEVARARRTCRARGCPGDGSRESRSCTRSPRRRRRSRSRR